MDTLQNNIEHEGLIKEIKENLLIVSIINQSACVSCKAKDICAPGDSSEKLITVNKSSTDNYKIGDKVTVQLKRSLGFRALFLGYLFPFLILMFSIVIMLNITKNNEGLSALTGIVITSLYYIVLYMKRDIIKQKFRFTLKE